MVDRPTDGYPEPRTLDEATAEATMRHAIASGIHWGSRSRALQRKNGIEWIGGTEWTLHLAFLQADTILAVALRALAEVSPERADQFAQEIHCLNQSGEQGEVLWCLAEQHDVDAQAIHDAAINVNPGGAES